MKKILFLMPLLSLVAASCNKSNRIPDLPKDLDLYKKENHYQKDGEGISCYGYTTFEYDGNLLTKKESYTGNDLIESVEYTYDEHDNLKTKTVTHPYGTLYYCTVYENDYDNQNRLIRVVEKHSKDQKEIWSLDSINEYIYDNHSITNKEYDYNEVLNQVTVYTFDNRGCLINRKADFVLEKGEGNEIDLTVNDAGCVVSATGYAIHDYKRGEIASTAKIEYLDNLWYRPTKIITENYFVEPHTYHTEINEYNDQQQLILFKSFEGLDESQISDYAHYNTYEY